MWKSDGRRAGARFLGAPLAVPFKVAPTGWSPAAVADRSTPTHGYYRRSFPQTVGRWHSDRSVLVSSGRVLLSCCSPSSTRRLSRRSPVYLFAEVLCVCRRHAFDNCQVTGQTIAPLAGAPTFSSFWNIPIAAATSQVRRKLRWIVTPGPTTGVILLLLLWLSTDQCA